MPQLNISDKNLHMVVQLSLQSMKQPVFKLCACMCVHCKQVEARSWCQVSSLIILFILWDRDSQEFLANRMPSYTLPTIWTQPLKFSMLKSTTVFFFFCNVARILGCSQFSAHRRACTAKLHCALQTVFLDIKLVCLGNTYSLEYFSDNSYRLNLCNSEIIFMIRRI